MFTIEVKCSFLVHCCISSELFSSQMPKAADDNEKQVLKLYTEAKDKNVLSQTGRELLRTLVNNVIVRQDGKLVVKCDAVYVREKIRIQEQKFGRSQRKGYWENVDTQMCSPPHPLLATNFGIFFSYLSCCVYHIDSPG